MKIKVNSLFTPFIDTPARFSWSLPDGEFASQSEYTLTIATDENFENTVFENTEKTDERINIYPEVSLSPLTKYFVKVRSALENGNEYTAKTHFSTGFMGTPWQARYITGKKIKNRDDALAAVYLRREFSAEKPLRAALYVVGLGYFEARINGKKVGDDFLSTAFTSYDKNILYRAFDVTDMVESGENAIGVILGNGFYNCFTQDPWQTSTAPWRDFPKLLLELHLEYEDHTEKILSDNNRSYIEGPIIFNGIRHGEEYDARLEKDGWDKAGFIGESHPANYIKSPGSILSVMEMEPIRVRKTLSPVLCRKVKNGWLYEFAQNTAGVAHITFRGKTGTRYKIRYCDRLYPDGELDQEALSGFIRNHFFQTDFYTKRSDEAESWNAIFTYHGFQYIEISGCDEPPALSDITALAFSNDLEERAFFRCSDEDINAIQHLCIESSACCFVNTVASDTVREKSSWTGDTGLSAEQIMINFGAESLMRKWQQDLRDTQRPGGCLPCIVPSAGWGYNSLNGPDWSHPMVDVPWHLYNEYGDLNVLRKNYNALKAHVSYISSMANDHIANYGLGDWCAPFEGAAISINMESFKCPVPVSDTAYFHSAVRMSQTYAHLLGFAEEEKEYAALAEKVKEAFRREFFDKDTYTVKGDCQSSTAMMVFHGLAEEDEIPHLAEKLLSQIERDNGHLDFGVLGCKAVMETLGKCGYADSAMKLLTNPTYPSMKHWLNMGTTTLLECWNGGGSRNHHMFSCVSAFFYKYVAGIRATSPAYRTIEFAPAVESSLSNAYASVNTPYGKAECGFEKAGEKTVVNITVPSSCKGTLKLFGKAYALEAGKHSIEI